MPVTAVACRMVPSTPARMAYRSCHSWAVWLARRAVTASWISRGRRNRWPVDRGSALGPGRAGPAGGGREPDDEPVAAAGAGGGPGEAGRALGAGDLLAVPVDVKHVRGVAAGAGLGGGRGSEGGEQGDAAGPGGQQQVRAGVRRVSGVLGGSQARGGEHVVHRLCHRGVRHGRGGGGHVRDQVRGCCPPGRQPAGGSRAARARAAPGFGWVQVSVRWTLYPCHPLPRFWL